MLPTLQRHFQFQERVSNSIWVIQGSLLSPQRPQNCQKMALTVPREKRNEGKRRESKAGRAEQTKETGILWSQIQVLPKLGTKSSHREFFSKFYFISFAGSSFSTNCGSSTEESSWLQPNRISAGWGAVNRDYSIPHCSYIAGLQSWNCQRSRCSQKITTLQPLAAPEEQAQLPVLPQPQERQRKK